MVKYPIPTQTTNIKSSTEPKRVFKICVCNVCFSSFLQMFPFSLSFHAFIYSMLDLEVKWFTKN